MGSQRHTPTALPVRKTRYPLYRRLGVPQEQAGRVWKISPSLCSKISLLILIIYLAERRFCEIFRAEISLVVNFFQAETRFMSRCADR